MIKDYERQQDQQESAIFAKATGGLNTTANPLNVPYEDSPFLLNCVTDISGNVLKRPGSRVVYRDAQTPDGVGLTNFATGLNYNFLIAKVGTSINVFEVNDDATTLVIQKTNVFDSAGSLVRPSIVSTSELEPRVLFFTGVDKPVQLKFVEQQHIKTTASTTAAVVNATRYKNATSSNIVVFVNRVRVVPTGVSYSAGTLTLTFGTSYPVGTVVDVTMILWQWWAEGISWQGDRMFNTQTRFNVVDTDQNVPIPEKLRTDLDPKETLGGAWNIIPFKKSTRVAGSAYTFSPSQPSTEDIYSFGDGARYVYATDNYVNNSPLYLTFGAKSATSTPTTVYMFRNRQLKLNNDTGALSGFVDVYVDGVKRSQSTANGDAADLVYKNYQLSDDNYAIISPATYATTKARYVGFGVNRLGVPPTSLVTWANAERAHIGTAAVGTLYNYDDGSYEIAYGLGTVADYLSGYYPKQATVYQGRLVLSGFAHRPLTVMFSSLNDTAVPGKFFMDFHVTNDDPTKATKPFDIVIDGRPDDRVVATIEWQASLFVLTRYACYRVFGGDQALSPTSRYVNYISSTGCVNTRCVAQTDTNVVYLSDSGLYDLTPQVENGEYQVRERSVKIRDKFGTTDDPAYDELAWVEYDIESRQVMVGYPAPGQFVSSRYIYVYNTYRDAWTEYNTPGGFNVMAAASYTDRLKGTRFVSALSWDITATTAANFTLVRFNDDRFIDFRQVATSGVSTVYSLPSKAEVIHTVTKGQQHFGVSFSSTGNVKAFTPNPVQEVNDINVLVLYPGQPFSVTTTKGVDWYKEESGYIYFNYPLPDTTQVLIYPTTSYVNGVVSGWGQWVVYRDNMVSTDYAINTTGTTFTFNVGVANQKIEWGQMYQAVYTSPMLTMQQLGNWKRMKHVYAYFDNRGVQRLYTAAEVNTLSGQDPQQLVDTYRTKAQCNITILYSSKLTGDTSADIYGYQDIYWDDSLMDIAPPGSQNQLFQLFKEPIQGVGYSIQLAVWSYDPDTFKLCGWQVDAKLKGKRYNGRNS